MDLAKEIIVRYREEGHVRFQIPEALCNPPIAERLAAELHRIEGVYRVDLSARQRKLSIRFIEHICDFRALGLALYRLIDAVEWAEPVAAAEPAGVALPVVLRKRLSAIHPIRWARGKLREARETVTAMGILARRQTIQQRALTMIDEDTIIHYLNDVLLIFLIKLHWPQITRQWMRQPWLHRYEWMAASYMIYLLVRSRRPKS